MTAVAIPWFVLETTGSAALTGVVGFFQLLPFVIATFVGGVFVDRFGFRRMSVVSDLASGVTVALIPLAYYTVGLPFAVLLALVFFGALLDAPGITARRSILPDAAELAGVSLERSNALGEGALQLKNLLGPLAAGLLIVAIGASRVLWVDAATFVASAILVLACVPKVAHALPEQHVMRERIVDQMLSGLRFVRHEPVLLWMSLTSLVANFLVAPMFVVLLPVYAHERLGSAAQLGVIVSAFGGAALFGSVLFGIVARRVNRRLWYLGTLVVSATGFCLLATMPAFPGAVVAVGLMGITSGTFRPLASTIRQERTPAHIRGRVFGALGALINGATPIGVVVAGVLVASFGLSTSLILFAGARVSLSIVAALIPALRDLSPPAPVAPVVPA